MEEESEFARNIRLQKVSLKLFWSFYRPEAKKQAVLDDLLPGLLLGFV